MKISVFLSVPDLILVGILVLTVLIGKKRGFISMVSGLIAFVGAWFCASRFSFVLDGILSRHIFSPLVTDLVSKSVDRAASETAAAAEAVISKIQTLTDTVQRFGVNINLPQMSGEFTDSARSALIRDIAQPFADKLSSAAAYLIIFLVVYILLRLILLTLHFLAKLPGLKNVNEGLGIAFGMILGCAYAWLGAQVLHILLGIWCADGTLPECMNPGYIMQFLTGQFTL